MAVRVDELRVLGLEQLIELEEALILVVLHDDSKEFAQGNGLLEHCSTGRVGHLDVPDRWEKYVKINRSAIHDSLASRSAIQITSETAVCSVSLT